VTWCPSTCPRWPTPDASSSSGVCRVPQAAITTGARTRKAVRGVAQQVALDAGGAAVLDHHALHQRVGDHPRAGPQAEGR